MSIIGSSIYTLIGKAFQVISTFGVGIVLARAIGPSGNGFYELMQLITVFSVTIGTLGVGHASVYVVKRKKFDISLTLSTVLTFGIIWGVIFGALIYAFYSIFPSTIAGFPRPALLISSILIPFCLLDAYLIQGFLIELRIKTQSLLIIVKNLLILICMAIFVGVFHFGRNGIIISTAITSITSAALIITVLKIKYRLSLTFNYPVFKEALVFGVKNWLANIFLLMNYKLDMFLVNYYLDVNHVGLYSVAVVIASSLLLIPSSIGPLLYSTWSGQPIPEVDRSTPKKSRQVVFITFIVALIVILIGKLLISLLYGPNFDLSYRALLLLLPGVIMITCNNVLLNNFSSRGKPMYGTTILAFALLTNIILNIILIPRYGIFGASFSSTISYTLSTILAIIIFTRIRQTSTSNNFIFANFSDIMEMKRAIQRLVFKRSTNQSA